MIVFENYQLGGGNWRFFRFSTLAFMLQVLSSIN